MIRLTAVDEVVTELPTPVTWEQLRNRSPVERWQELKGRFLMDEPAQAPADAATTPFQPVPEPTEAARIPEEVGPSSPIAEPDPFVPAATAEALTANPASAVVQPPLTYDTPPVREVSQQTQPVPGGVPPAPNGPPPGFTPVPPAPSGGPKAINTIVPFYNEDVDADIRRTERPFGTDVNAASRQFPLACVTWEASNFYHYPLYFEDVQLERYGHTYPHLLQPFVSGAKFSAQLLGLPYSMTIDPLCKHMYTLGYYQPGDCAPYLHYQIPFNAHAAAVTGAFYTGMFFLIP